MHEVPRRSVCREVHGETATELFLRGFQAVINSSGARCLAAANAARSIVDYPKFRARAVLPDFLLASWS